MPRSSLVYGLDGQTDRQQKGNCSVKLYNWLVEEDCCGLHDNVYGFPGRGPQPMGTHC